jgi:hypothetical protein
MIVAVPLASQANEPRAIEHLIAEARTAADYAVIASYYQEQARAARQRQQHYEAQRTAAEAKRSGPVKRTGAVALHTASIAHAENEAKAYESLAEYYRKKEQLVR